MDKTFVVDVRVDKLDSLFSSLDPSPFRQRDLDPRAVEHIVQWASDAPPKVPIVLNIHITGQEHSIATEAESQQAVCNYFEYEALLLGRRHLRNRNRMLKWLAVGIGIMIILLTFHAFTKRMWPESYFNDVVGEAFVIAGWVSLWVPIERLGYDGLLLRDQLSLFRRLSVMRVEVFHV